MRSPSSRSARVFVGQARDIERHDAGTEPPPVRGPLDDVGIDAAGLEVETLRRDFVIEEMARDIGYLRIVFAAADEDVADDVSWQQRARGGCAEPYQLVPSGEEPASTAKRPVVDEAVRYRLRPAAVDGVVVARDQFVDLELVLDRQLWLGHGSFARGILALAAS